MKRLNWPIYQIRHEFGGREIASAFGLEGLRATVPALEPELYAIHEWHPQVYAWRCVGSATRYRTGHWEIDLSLASGEWLASGE